MKLATSFRRSMLLLAAVTISGAAAWVWLAVPVRERRHLRNRKRSCSRHPRR